MLSRNLVLDTLEFKAPHRIPRQLWLLPWAELNFAQECSQILADFPPDIIRAPGYYKKALRTCGDPYKIGNYTDEWGCEFENKQDGIIGEVKHPIVQSWDDLKKVRPPLESLTVDRDSVEKFCKDSDEFVVAGCCPRPFERLQFLRGTENVMMDLACGDPACLELLEVIHRFNLDELNVWAKTAVDGLAFMDDWGTQHSLLISPDMWRKIFKPLYRDYIEIAHSSGKKMFMHSDGFILDIIPDLIELGVDALNSQIFCMDVRRLGSLFKGKITFWGELDRQHILPQGTQQDVADAVKLMYENLYQNGGIIAQCEFGPGAKPENVRQFFACWDNLKV